MVISVLVISVLVIKKRLRKKEYDSEVRNPRESRVNIPIIIAVFLVGSVLISGIIILYIGIRDTFRAEWLSRNYTAVTGYFEDYNIYDSDEEGVTYRLIYTYQVNGKEYQVSADYGVGYLPEYGSERKVLYNPENHGEAVLAGTNSNKGMIFFGVFFVLGATVFILIGLQIKGVFDNVKTDVIGVYVGVVFVVIGVGSIAFQRGMVASLIEMLKIMKFWILIPIMLIVAGGIQVVRSLRRTSDSDS